ncbi:MAG TPA: bifunctional diaminohydroxyphosphoribosylaminopyrimidine deaminase/5-amino-6-(5-phosphoribosylamino)uracil reductase RibD [Desulfuromonadales bacterium]|nr:bifunctional diaminohydroxyphosphoribosylaminopyrimidine deaminase/5-amino-6-(5-phosphoribosylamino)uracil reductase RibD [Desulfuromonadales bacterium]
MPASEQFMQDALELARRGEGRTAPNPPVGAVLVKQGRVVGEGFHPAAGQPHAEIFALQQAGEDACGASLYVTLEPCSHQGRTGPCADALIEADVAEVIIGTLDPNPAVSGEGVARLRRAGIAVTVGVLEEECRRLITPFAKFITTGLPYVLFKSAMTLDGRIATASGDSRWISGEKSRQMVHRLRARVDGILVGSGTVLTDDPRLTTRLDEQSRNAARIVIDSRLLTSSRAAVYSPDGTRRVLVTSADHSPAALAPFADLGVEIVRLASQGRFLAPAAIMAALAERDFMFLMLEGGGGLGGALLRGGFVDRMMLFIAPLLIGGDNGKALMTGIGVERIDDAWRLSDVEVRRVEQDILVEGEVRRCLPG